MSGTTISATGNFGYVSTNWQIDGLGSPAPTIYSYSASYDKVGNVAGYTDSVNGTWSFTYDSLNRVARATGSQDSNPYPNYCWQYDSFSNREWQTSSATPYSTSNGGANSCPVSAGPSTGAGYNANNQISGGSFAYDPAGNVSGDTTTGNSYLYDGEGRVCAMQQSIVGPPVMTGYLYDAEGHRVAKGSLTHFTCDTNANGFTATAVYVLGPSGEQMTEMTNSSGTWQWVHTNVYAPGLSATYDADLTEHTEGSLYFDLSDWLGTRRQQTDYAGNPCLNFTSLPYGDGLTPITVSCLSPSGDATEHHFTGKERDTESGNDYFGARYYASTMGRWLSPDPGGISLKHLANPQKWNKYAYTINNPLRYFDPDGMVEMDVQLRSFIQQKSVSDPLGRHFAGDNRGPTSSQNVTSRTTITVRIETDPSIRPGNPIISQTPGSAGQTKQLDANGNVIKTGTATTGLPTVTGGRDANGNPVLTFNQDTKNPLEPQSVTPGISAQNLGVTVGQNGSWVETSGDLSLSPSFELNIGGNNIPLESELPGAAFGAGLIAPDVPVYNFTVLPPPPPPPPQQPHQ
jgi:RHS repeat-associated protein